MCRPISYFVFVPSGEPVQGDLKEIGDPDQVIVTRTLLSRFKTLVLPKGDTEGLGNSLLTQSAFLPKLF